MENMDEIIISTTKFSDIVPLIFIAFFLALTSMVLWCVWAFCYKDDNKETAEEIKNLKKEIKNLKNSANNIRYVDKCYIKLLNKRLNRLKMPVYADEKKKNE